MNNYVETQNKLIAYAQVNLAPDKGRVDAVVFNGKEFIVFMNTHASSYPPITHYINRGGKGFDELEKIIKG